MTFDVLITGGQLVDGSGAPGTRGDLGIRRDRIADLGDLAGATAKRVIDATGLIVAPGFIDPHNHANDEAAGGILSIPQADNYVRQGVTTLVVGNCGGCTWPVAEHFAAVEALAIRQNYAMLLGMGTLRAMAVRAEGRPANHAETRRMQDLVAQGMDEGALGMSTGYFPSYVTVDEMAEVARAVAVRGGIYTSHIRSESDGLLGSLEEIIQVGARAEVPVQVSHIKTYGKRNWHKVGAALSLLERGRERGVDIMADRYPYVACFTGVSALVPMWAPAEAKRGAELERLRRAVADQLHLIGGPENVMFAPLKPRADLDGKRLSDVAREWGQDPVDTALELSRESGISCIYFAMCEENIAEWYRHPQVMVGSDGHVRRFGEGVSHPRNYGTFPRAIGHYGRDRGLFGVEEAVMKCTSLAAARYGLAERGLLARGNFADVTVFDWSGIRDCATFTDQHRYPEGIPWVIVNGKVAVQQGEVTRGCYGRVVRKG